MALGAAGDILSSPSNARRITTPALTVNAAGADGGSITVSTAVETLTARITGGEGGIVVYERDSVILALLTAQDGSIRVSAGGTITATDVETLTDRTGDDVTLIATSGDVLIGYVAAGYVAGAHRYGQVSVYSAHDIREAPPYDATVDLRAHKALLYARHRIGGQKGADLELDVDYVYAFTGGATHKEPEWWHWRHSTDVGFDWLPPRWKASPLRRPAIRCLLGYGALLRFAVA